MTCERCFTGLMVPVPSLVHESTADYHASLADRQTDTGAWKCLLCGNVEDPCILQHRARPLAPRSAGHEESVPEVLAYAQ